MIKIHTNIKTPAKIDVVGLKKRARQIFELLDKKKDYEFELNLVCPMRMKKINKQFRKQDKSTTVLSFVDDEIKDKFASPPSDYKYLGEIFLCPEEINKQSKRLKISTENLMTEVLVHGILHLLGYRHDDERAREKMERQEKEIICYLEFY